MDYFKQFKTKIPSNILSFDEYVFESDASSTKEQKVLLRRIGRVGNFSKDKLSTATVDSDIINFLISNEWKLAHPNVHKTAVDYKTIILKSDKENSEYWGNFYLNGDLNNLYHIRSSTKSHLNIVWKLGNNSKIGAEEFESLICYMYNQTYFNINDVKNQEISNTTQKVLDYIELVEENIQPMIGKIRDLIIKFGNKNKYLVQNGRNSAVLSDFWIKYGGTNKTPKTDLYIDGKKYRISLKDSKGSQLMSSSYDETRATFEAAYDMFKTYENKKFETSFYTITDPKNWESLKLDSSITQIKDEISSKGSFKSRGASYEQINSVVSELDNNSTAYKLAQQWLNNINLTETMHKIANSTEFATYFVYEAMTGNYKFSDQLSKANQLLKFNENKSTADLINIDFKYAKQIASKTKFTFAFKSSGRRSWTTLRAIVNESEYSIDDLLSESMHQAYQMGNQDFVINENFRNIFKNASKKIINYASKIKDVIERGLFLFISKISSMLMRIIKQGWYYVEKALNISTSISIPQTVIF